MVGCYGTPRATTRTRLMLYILYFQRRTSVYRRRNLYLQIGTSRSSFPCPRIPRRSANSKFYVSRSEMNCTGGMKDVGLYERLDSMPAEISEPHWSAKMINRLLDLAGKIRGAAIWGCGVTCSLLPGRASGEKLQCPRFVATVSASTYASGLGVQGKTVVDSFGNVFSLDIGGGNVWEIPVGGGAPTIVASPGCGTSGLAIAPRRTTCTLRRPIAPAYTWFRLAMAPTIPALKST